jgi:hypothetical protein
MERVDSNVKKHTSRRNDNDGRDWRPDRRFKQIGERFEIAIARLNERGVPLCRMSIAKEMRSNPSAVCRWLVMNRPKIKQWRILSAGEAGLARRKKSYAAAVITLKVKCEKICLRNISNESGIPYGAVAKDLRKYPLLLAEIFSDG